MTPVTLRPGFRPRSIQVSVTTCETCGRPVDTFAEWFTESCPQEIPPNYGHKLSWVKIMALQLRPQLQQEAKQ